MTKPSAWRAFLWPEGHRLPETSCAGRAPHGPSQPPDMPNRDRSTPYRPPCTASAFPAKAFPSRSIPARVSDQAYSPRRSGPTMRQQPRAAPRVPPASLPGIPKHAFTSRHPHKTFLCTKSVPPCGVLAAIIKELSRRSLHRKKAPSHTSRGIPATRKQARARERKNSGIFSPQLSPALLFPTP